jgi:hypothetical protein
LESGDPRLAASSTRALERIGGPAAEATLLAEAKRHRAADRAEYRQLRETGDPHDMARFLRELSQPRRLQLAATAAADSDPDYALLGLRLYLEAGRDAEAAAALADLVARDDRGLQILAALGQLLREVGRPEIQGGLHRDIVTRLESAYADALPEDRARIARALDAMGAQPH